ncbi:hypothetical protein Ddye_021949 [Dipteronia dyeriana]|uniref:DUF679 domain membrane protein 2 n=1 Tax=Dipteronia dyeriana TaxID=168575 RepID=A0AAD9WWS8_9ROSI|nr:hypothetical protein Ddye_021949 [Dipteronia dyeriana]
MATTSFSSSSSSNKSISHRTFTGFGSLIKLLPTGTVFVFQFLNPVVTNSGHCTTLNKYLTSFLIGFCGLACGLSCFTDSYRGSDGMPHYGVTTMKGLWPSTAAGSVELSKYKLRIGDFVHCFFTMVVFAVVSLLDSNTVECLFPSFESTEKVLLMVLPPVIGTICSTVFMVFPNYRHGIGYPHATSDSSDDYVRL